MTAAAATAEVRRVFDSTDDAVEYLWLAVEAGNYKNVAEAARDLWRTFKFKPNDLQFLACYGLTELAKSEQRVARNHKRPAIVFGAPRSKKEWAQYTTLESPYAGAEGQQKPLLQFSADDLAAFAAYAGTMESAYKRRREFAVEALDFINEHGVATIGDLPSDVLSGLEERASEMLGRQE